MDFGRDNFRETLRFQLPSLGLSNLAPLPEGPVRRQFGWLSFGPMLLRSGKPVEISFTGHLCVLTLRPWQPDASSLCTSRDTRRSDFPSPPPPADKSTCFGVSCFASTLSPKALVYPFHLLDPSPEGWPFWSFPYSHSPEGAAIRDLPILPDSIGLLNV